MTRSSASLGVAPLALVFFGLLAFFNAINHPFVHDDVIFILQNPHITQLDRWYEAFNMAAASDGINTYYRPVLEVLYRLEYHFFGPHPSGYHLFNVIVHIANGLLIFCLLKKLGLREVLAWVVACIFLIHPVQTEAVCCISGISNLWMALGILLALNAYVNKWYAACLLCFAMAFLSKEQAIMFVPLVMVIDYSRGVKNFPWWFFWFVVAGILLWLRHSVTGVSLVKDIMVSPGELYLRLACIPRVIGMDLRLIFCPYDLHYYRNTDILQSNSIAWAWALISIAGIVYVSRRWSQARPAMILGLGWFLAALFPVLNIAPLIDEYSFILTSEHFLYLPIIGILIVVVVAADHYLTSHGRHARHSQLFVIPAPINVIPAKAGIFKGMLLGLVVSSCLLLTWHQNTFWRSEIALFERMLRFEPDFGRGHLLLAKAYYFNGRPDLAAEHFKKAFTIMTTYAMKASNPTAKKFYLDFEKEILFDWAQNDCAMGHWQAALDKLKQEAAIDDKNAGMYNNMAFVYLHLGDKKDAYLSLEQALRVDPSFTQARRNLLQLGAP